MTTLPNNAHDFVKFMESVWDGPAYLYDRYENAKRTAILCGAVRTGGTRLDGESAHLFRFPADNGHTAVQILPKGNGCKLSYHKWASHSGPRKLWRDRWTESTK